MRVKFDEPSHKYTDTVTQDLYISVTTLIGQFCPPFDSDYWATYKALKDTLEPLGQWWKYKKKAGGWDKAVDYYLHFDSANNDAVDNRKQWYLDKWEKEKNDACDLGTQRHKEKEIEVLGQEVIHDDIVHPAYSCDVDVFKGHENGIFAELLIYDCEYAIAGTVDFVRKTGKHIWISDYKTSKKITNEPFMNKKMLFPVDELYDTTFNHYMLQLSMYGYLLERKGFIIDGLDIIHITRDTGEHRQTIEMPYRPDLIKLIFNNYKNA